MSFQRKSLAGRDKDGTLRGGPEHYNASELLGRLRRYAPAAREALQHTAETWAEVRSKECRDRGLKPTAYNSQERVFMQVFGLSLELSASHHPPLIVVFPLLLAWIRNTLGYVVELEGLVETGERTIAGLDRNLEQLNEHLEAVTLERDHMAGVELPDLSEQLTRLTERFERERKQAADRERDLLRDLEVAESKRAAAESARDSWALTAKASAAALAVVARGAGVPVDFVDVAPDEPQLPATTERHA